MDENGLSGWAKAAPPAEEPTEPRYQFRESQELRAWIEQERERISERDAKLYPAAATHGGAAVRPKGE